MGTKLTLDQAYGLPSRVQANSPEISLSISTVFVTVVCRNWNGNMIAEKTEGLPTQSNLAEEERNAYERNKYKIMYEQLRDAFSQRDREDRDSKSQLQRQYEEEILQLKEEILRLKKELSVSEIPRKMLPSRSPDHTKKASDDCTRYVLFRVNTVDGQALKKNTTRHFGNRILRLFVNCK